MAEQNISDDRPVVLMHRIRGFDLSVNSWLPQFRLLDPFGPSFSSPEAQAQAQSVRVLLCVGPSPLTSETLDRYPSVECVVCSSAGIDHIDLAACRRLGITVTNASDAFSEDAADYAVGLLIDVLRCVSASDRYVRSGSWLVKGEYPLGSKVISVFSFHSLLAAK